MADESFQDRTETASPKRRREAREKGEVPRSPEVSTAFLFLASAGALHVGGQPLATSILNLFGNATISVIANEGDIAGVVVWIRGLGWMTLAALAPIMLTIGGAALAVGAIQARGVISMAPLTPKWERVSPLKGAKRLWGWKALMELGKSLLKLAIIGMAGYFALARAFLEVPPLSQQSPYTLLLLIERYGTRLLLSVGIAYIGIALIDYGYQIWQSERQLKMSKEEVKRENKETDGDPFVKARRTSMARALARRRMMLSVSDADVVVTNPTHIAVALKYDTNAADAPIVLALGVRKVAERIKALATEAGVPIVENKPLARTLLAAGKVGQPIPVELYVAVAEVLAFIFRKRGQQMRHAEGSVS